MVFPTVRLIAPGAALVLLGCASSSSSSTPASGSAASTPPRAAAPAATGGADSLLFPGERHLANPRQLTFEGNNAEAYFSADGTKLIFQRQVDGQNECDQQFVINVDGTGLRRVSSGEGRTTCGYFYDGDRRILYSSTHEHSPACPPPPDHAQGYVWPLSRFEIYSQALDGSDRVRLTNNGAYNAEATVSEDGSRIIFTSTRDGDIELYTMNPDGSDVRRVTSRVGYDGGAFFSPDGRRIVWRAQYPVTSEDTADYRRLLAQRLVRPSRLELWTANADGSDARQVTSLGGANFAPFFHPDGKRIIFASNHENPRGRNFDLYIVGVDGTGLERVTTSPEFDGFPMFSRDGRRIVFASNRNARVSGETNIFIADWIE
jgi:Tol biopolymer transport system component